MTSLNIPRTLSNNTVADANHVMDNFIAIRDFTNVEVVRTDGSIKAGTNAIADDAVTAAKIAAGAVGTTEIAANAVTNDKLATGYAALTYQDHTLTGLTDLGFGLGWSTGERNIALLNGKQYTNVVSVQCLGGSNAYGMSADITRMGLKTGQLLAGEIVVRAIVSDNAAGGNYAIVRIWTT
jgi:hypothetical protein